MKPSPHFCAVNRVMVTNDHEGRIQVECCPSTNTSALHRLIRELEQHHGGARVSTVMLSESDLMRNLASRTMTGDGTDRTVFPGGKQLEAQYGEDDDLFSDNGDILSIEQNAPVITLLNSILVDGREHSASDIHIEIGENDTRIRKRMDGRLSTSSRLPRPVGKALAQRIKLLANLNTLETRRPQDGRFSIMLGGHTYDIRVSAVPLNRGESVVMRFFAASTETLTVHSLGFDRDTVGFLERMAQCREGLVLFTGATGSGKTTSLAALLRSCGPETRKIISIEDPIEYRIDGVIQIQTHEAIGLGFAELLKRILRQDPDIIMVGEIRDGETAALAVRAALTGHLVLSTLHTATPEAAVNRLRDLGIADYLISAVLRSVIGLELTVSPQSGLRRQPSVRILDYAHQDPCPEKGKNAP